eukprot:3478707-Rhodomonas_salina.4
MGVSPSTQFSFLFGDSSARRATSAEFALHSSSHRSLMLPGSACSRTRMRRKQCILPGRGKMLFRCTRKFITTGVVNALLGLLQSRAATR